MTAAVSADAAARAGQRPAAGGPPTRVVVGGALVALVGLLLGGWAYVGRDLPTGSSVLAVDVGGLSRREAVAKLERELRGPASERIPVRVSGASYSVDPRAAGLTFDAEATVAIGRRPSAVVGALLARRRGGPLAPVVRVDESRLSAAVAALATRVDRPVREGMVSFSGLRPVATYPRPGQALDRPAAAAAIRRSYLAGPDVVALPVRPVAPTATAAEVDRAVREYARPAVAAPVTVLVGDRRVRLPPAQIAATLRMSPDPEGGFAPVLDGRRLRGWLLANAPGLGVPAVDATFRIVDERPRVVPGRPGRTVDPAMLRDALVTVLPRPTQRVATVALVAAPPALSTEEARALGVVEMVSTFTQRCPYAYYRVHNIGTAAGYLGGTLLEPGEVFSMNATVRERTPANGYVVGTVIDHGRFREDLGGGVSTITTAVWDAAFHAGLERVEQRAHSFFISRYKPGLEATVSYGKLDLRFRNNTPHGIYLTAKVRSSSVTVTMWGTKRYDVEAISGPRYNTKPYRTVDDASPGCVPQSGVAGYDIDVTRVLRQGGTEVTRETFKTEYNPAAQVYCRPRPSPSPSPRPSPSVG